MYNLIIKMSQKCVFKEKFKSQQFSPIVWISNNNNRNIINLELGKMTNIIIIVWPLLDLRVYIKSWPDSDLSHPHKLLGYR